MVDNSTDIHDQEEAEEALSLCDLPLDDDNNDSENHFKEFGRAPPEPTELFEFFSDLSSEMCPADDIIFCGKLIPFKEPIISLSPSTTNNQTPKQQHTTKLEEDNNKKKTPTFRQRRSESVSDIQYSSMTRSNSSRTNDHVLKRNSRSLDYGKLNRYSSYKVSSDSQEMERNSCLRSISGKNKAVKPRWYLLIFGMVKIPTEMELSDIKSRQIRRNLSSMFPPPPVNEAQRKCPVNRNNNKGSCKKSTSILKALSCRDDSSVCVTAPYCIPQA